MFCEVPPGVSGVTSESVWIVPKQRLLLHPSPNPERAGCFRVSGKIRREVLLMTLTAATILGILGVLGRAQSVPVVSAWPFLRAG